MNFDSNEIRGSAPPALILTLDVDWAPDPVVADCLDLLDRFEVPATLFFTHEPGKALRNRLEESDHEIGIHPHAETATVEQFDQALRRLSDAFPEATSVRNHKLLSSTPILERCSQRGLRITSNTYFRHVPVPAPLPIQWGLQECPIYEMDYFLLSEVEALRAGPAALEVGRPGMCVLCFHPIHIFLNSPSLSFYELFKARSDGSLRKGPPPSEWPRSEKYGIRDYLTDLLVLLPELETVRVQTLREFVEPARRTA